MAKIKDRVFLAMALVVVLIAAPTAKANPAPYAAPGPGQGYATDAYPGFDREDGKLAPSKKEPRWFAWINGPKCDNVKEQFAYCESLEAEGDYKGAAKGYDALVREWPQSEEAPKAQLKYAELLLTKLEDTIEAFAEYRYMLDFYPIYVDYNETIDKLYKIAQLMRDEGKYVLFFHFDNTVDVRRAFEACVLRAPGAKWAPKAMLMIAELREEEGKPEEAIKVYENLRNLHRGTEESMVAFYLEAKVRMKLLQECGYNRSRILDTINYLKLALLNCEIDKVQELKVMLDEVKMSLEDEAYRAAVFYDSKTRTVRSAINAYERFLTEYPDGVYADKVRSRLDELKKDE